MFADWCADQPKIKIKNSSCGQPKIKIETVWFRSKNTGRTKGSHSLHTCFCFTRAISQAQAPSENWAKNTACCYEEETNEMDAVSLKTPSDCSSQILTDSTRKAIGPGPSRSFCRASIKSRFLVFTSASAFSLKASWRFWSRRTRLLKALRFRWRFQDAIGLQLLLSSSPL